MELTVPAGPPSYEATMSATMNVNPAFADEGSLNSGFNHEDYELPPSYESIANETVQNQDSDSQNVTTPSQTTAPTSNTDTTESEPTYSSINESSSSSPKPPTEAEPIDEPPPTLDDGGNHI